MDSQDIHPSHVQMLPPTQQMIENNNNQPMVDPSQKRRLSRAHDNNFDKTPTQMENHMKTNDTHYIKNKTLQSPVGRYKVCEDQSTPSSSFFIQLK